MLYGRARSADPASQPFVIHQDTSFPAIAAVVADGEHAEETCANEGAKAGKISLPGTTCNAMGWTDEVKFTCCQ